MILAYLVTAALVGPITYLALGRSSRKRRLVIALVAVAIAWLAETAFFVMVGDPIPEGARTIDP